VVIPVYNSASLLERCLEALSCSVYSGFECIVVDDGSGDESADVAGRHGAAVLRLDNNRGPSHARNRGAERATGEILLFIDADVCVHPETVGAVVEALNRYPEAAALIGSYDLCPADPSFLSQYKNLFHHFVHQHGNTEANTFWTGCGAVRRDVFLALGGLHEGYSAPSIEDIEFGYRLRRAGYRIRLEKGIQITHLKRWTFRDLVRTDVFRRGVPWIALMLRDRYALRDLNFSLRSRASTALAYGFVLAVAGLAVFGQLPAALLSLGPLLLGALTAVVRDTHPGLPWRVIPGAGLALLTAAAWVMQVSATAFLPLGLLLAILWINRRFFAFFNSLRGFSFAFAAIPHYLLFCLYSGVCLPLGAWTHLQNQRRARRFGVGPSTVPSRPLKAADAVVDSR
jgi:GT2 family glycosyltransferase